MWLKRHRLEERFKVVQLVSRTFNFPDISSFGLSLEIGVFVHHLKKAKIDQINNEKERKLFTILKIFFFL